MGFYTFVCIFNAFVFLKIVAACATPSINVVFGVPMPRLKEMIFDGNVMHKFDDFFAIFFFQNRPNDQNYEFEKKSKTISAKTIFIFMFLSSPGISRELTLCMQSFLKIGLCGLLEGEKKLNFQYKSRIICQCHFLTQSHRSIFLINNPFLKKIFVLFNKPKTFAIRSN